MTTYEEWRITGDPGPGYPPYQFTFSQRRGDRDPEAAARKFIAQIAEHTEAWTSGPHLHKRTVTATDWEPA